MNMTQEDWDKLYSEWAESYNQPVADKPSKVDSYSKGYLYEEGRGTPKARFFITEDGLAGLYGFWCPKSAILDNNSCEDGSGELEVASRCKLTIIEYNRG